MQQKLKQTPAPAFSSNFADFWPYPGNVLRTPSSEIYGYSNILPSPKTSCRPLQILLLSSLL